MCFCFSFRSNFGYQAGKEVKYKQRPQGPDVDQVERVSYISGHQGAAVHWVSERCWGFYFDIRFCPS